MPLTGSFDSTAVDDFLVTPWAMNYGRLINFDHDFIGREALQNLSEADQPRKVWLRWDEVDAMRLMRQSLFGGTQRAKTVDLPNLQGASIVYDEISKNGRRIGVANLGGYTVNMQAIVSLAMVDPGVEEGDEVTIHWGEPERWRSRPMMEQHVMSEVKARVTSIRPEPRS